jgi:hypothetical protein
MADETELDEGYSPTPAVSSPPDVDLELDLQDQAADDVGAVVAAPEPPPLGTSPAYDFIRGAFIPSAAGGPLMIRGLATLAQWCEGCLHTVQGENPAVDPSYGLRQSLESIFLTGAPLDGTEIAEAEDVITEAFTQHPRIAEVLDFAVDYTEGDDVVYLSYTIPTEGDDEEDDEQEPLVANALPVVLNGGGDDG